MLRRAMPTPNESAVNEPLRLCVWSGPRNVSTALMYAFAQRSDTKVLDEPLYGHYLRTSGSGHPGRDEVLAALDNDGERVVREVILGPCERPILFVKQMAHHLLGLDWAFLARTVNVLLIRDPAEMLTSLVNQLPEPTLRDTGLGLQVDLLRHQQALGQHPPVIDAREILLDPEGVLRTLCERLGIAFDRGMLEWSAGPRPEDGVWARHWYDNVHRSTGFAPYRPKNQAVPPRLAELHAQCQRCYDELFDHAIRADASKQARVPVRGE